MSHPFTATIVRDGPPPLSDADLDSIYAVGADLYAHERWGEAMDVFRLLVLVSPTDAKAWIALGACHEAQGDEERAVSLYQVASCASCRIDARRAQVYLAGLFAKMGRTTEAKEILDTITQDDSDPEALVAMLAKARAMALENNQ